MAEKKLVSSSPLKSVRVDALVVMKICKHAASGHPQTVTGQLLGMDVDGELQITNSFAFPSIENTADFEHHGAGGAPRTKQNQWYQGEMIRTLRDQNVDANSAGWYGSASFGNFVNSNFIQNQVLYQSALNERAVALIHDTARSASGAFSLRAFRLTPAFLAAHKEDKFTLESLAKHNLSYASILTELPVTVHNSHLATTLLHQLSTPPSTAPLPLSLDTPLPLPLTPNLDSLLVNIDPFFAKTCDNLLDSIETHYSELNNQQYHQRQVAREQTKIAAWQTKRKSENQLRAAAKQPLLPEDEWMRLFKMPQEPSRLEMLLNSRQVEQYAGQVDAVVAGTTAKMFAVKDGLAVTE